MTDPARKYCSGRVVLMPKIEIPKHHYLVGQRRFLPGIEYLGFLECFGVSIGGDVGEDGLREYIAKKLDNEIKGVVVESVDDLVHEFERPFTHMPNEPAEFARFERYLSRHFVARVKLPEVITTDPAEHIGSVVLSLDQVCALKPAVRPCSFEAIMKTDRLLYGHKIDPEG